VRDYWLLVCLQAQPSWHVAPAGIYVTLLGMQAPGKRTRGPETPGIKVAGGNSTAPEFHGGPPVEPQALLLQSDAPPSLSSSPWKSGAPDVPSVCSSTAWHADQATAAGQAAGQPALQGGHARPCPQPCARGTPAQQDTWYVTALILPVTA